VSGHLRHHRIVDRVAQLRRTSCGISNNHAVMMSALALLQQRFVRPSAAHATFILSVLADVGADVLILAQVARS
jgi:hypothetical protein